MSSTNTEDPTFQPLEDPRAPASAVESFSLHGAHGQQKESPSWERSAMSEMFRYPVDTLVLPGKASHPYKCREFFLGLYLLRGALNDSLPISILRLSLHIVVSWATATSKPRMNGLRRSTAVREWLIGVLSMAKPKSKFEFLTISGTFTCFYSSLLIILIDGVIVPEPITRI